MQKKGTVRKMGKNRGSELNVPKPYFSINRMVNDGWGIDWCQVTSDIYAVIQEQNNGQ